MSYILLNKSLARIAKDKKLFEVMILRYKLHVYALMMVEYVLHVRKAIGVVDFDLYCVVHGFKQ